MTTESQRVELVLCRNSSAERKKNEGLFSMKGQKNARGTVGRIITNELGFGRFQFRESLGIRRHCRLLSPGRVDREMRTVIIRVRGFVGRVC